MSDSSLQPRSADVLTALFDENESLKAKVKRLSLALNFYADPDTYFACGFRFDPPTGGFDDDFSDDHGEPFFDRPMPGKLAREALLSLQ